MPIYATGFDDAGESTDALLELIIHGRPAWMRRGVRRIPSGGDVLPERGEDVRPAKRICDGCLCFWACREWSLQPGRADLAGIWGGLSQRERKEARARTPRPVPTPVAESILATLAAHPGQTRIAARASVSCGLWAFDRAFRQLVADGAILNDQPDRVYGHGGRVTTRWYLAAPAGPCHGGDARVRRRDPRRGGRPREHQTDRVLDSDLLRRWGVCPCGAPRDTMAERPTPAGVRFVGPVPERPPMRP